jgi:hypothetical protein
MKAKTSLAILTLAAAATVFAAKHSTPGISGEYLEVRSCDVYTGPCFANAEVGLTGREGILAWSIREGQWEGTRLDGLKAIAVLRTDATLGDQRYTPRTGRAVLILDETANARQRAALAGFVRAMAGTLICEVVDVKTAPIQARIGTCAKSGCASLTAGSLVKIMTRCFGEQDHICGNEETFYPPLTEVASAWPAFTELAAFKGSGLDLTWEATGQRSAFIGHFAR